MANRFTKALGGEIKISGGIAHFSTRSNIGGWHVIAAAKFAEAAGELEAEFADQEAGDFFQDIASNVMATIFFSVAAIEAAINELFKDAPETIPEQSPKLVRELWITYEIKTNLLDKYDLALLLKGKNKLDRGAKFVQHAEDLVRLRNALVHFKPESSDEDGLHKKLEA